MKFRHLLLPTLALFLAVQASALPILVGEFPANSGDNNEKIAVRDRITSYNTANDPDLPQLFSTGSTPSLINGWTEFVAKTTNVSPFYSGGDDKTISWTAPTSYTSFYILTKWGQGQANFDHALHFLSAGDTLLYNPGGTSAPQGLSHLSIWAVGPANQVPDSGATISLLGFALVCVGLLRKRFGR